MAAAQERSKFDVKEDERVAGAYKALAGDVGPTRFLGYDGRGTTGEGVVKAILAGGARVPRAEAGAKVQLAFDQTPFYAESGGQIGDTGSVRAPGGAVRIDDTRKPAGDVHVLIGEVTEGAIAVGDKLFFTNDRGQTFVVRAGRAFTLLHVNDLQAQVLASPALVDGVWYWRTDKELLAIAD